MSSLPQPGQVVQVTFTGKVDFVESVQAVVLPTSWVKFTDGTVIAVGDDPVAFTVVTEPYLPRFGDVATYKTGTSYPVTIQYRRGYSAQGVKVLAWFNEYDMIITEPETDSTFVLILRDGVLQEGAR